jgi:hypothetical protein
VLAKNPEKPDSGGDEQFLDLVDEIAQVKRL